MYSQRCSKFRAIFFQIFHSVLRTNKNFITWRVQWFEGPIPLWREFFRSKIKFLANDILDNWKSLKVLLICFVYHIQITQIMNSCISLSEERDSLIDFWWIVCLVCFYFDIYKYTFILIIICIILWKVRFLASIWNMKLGLGARTISKTENSFHFTKSHAWIIPLMWVWWQWN